MMIKYILYNILRVVQLLVLVRICMTWIYRERYSEPFKWFTGRVDRLLKPFRILIPMGPAFIDLGPLLFLLLTEGLMRVIVAL